MGSHSPLVSVIVPTYDRPEYLGQALASVLAQRCDDLEVIVSDDAGPNDIGSLVESFGDRRLKYRRNTTNLGVLGNTVAALGQAGGKYIAILNDDDLWGPLFLERLVAALEDRDDLVVAFCDHYIIDSEGRIDAAATERRTHDYSRDRLSPGVHHPFGEIALVNRSIGAVMGAVFRRRSIDWAALPAEAGPAYDTWILYLAAKSGLGACYVPERLTYYRYHTGQQTFQSVLDFHLGLVFCYQAFLDDQSLWTMHRQLRALLGTAYVDCGLTLVRAGRAREARASLMRGLWLGPGPRSVVGLLLTLGPSWAPRWVTRVVRTSKGLAGAGGVAGRD